jgi:hemerythrin
MNKALTLDKQVEQFIAKLDSYIELRVNQESSENNIEQAKSELVQELKYCFENARKEVAQAMTRSLRR